MHSKLHPTELVRKANGIGIVCGLEVIVEGDCTLSISHGYGFTSKGLLLHFPEKHFKYYRIYEKGVRGLIDEDNEIDIWELVENKQAHTHPLSPQVIREEPFIFGKVVLLYIDEEDDCNIKPLLISKEDLWEIIQDKSNIDIQCLPLDGEEPEDIDVFDYGDDEFPNGRTLFCTLNRNTSLKPIYLMRFGFATDENECEPEEREFKISSADFDGLYNEYDLIILDGLEQLQKRINLLHQPIFSDLIPEQQRKYLHLYFQYLKRKRYLSFKEAKRKIFIQYFYSLIRDLVTTYNELVYEFCQLMADCCPDEHLFPYHLLLGEVEEDIAFGDSIFRHHFRQPAIYNDNRLRFQKIRFLHWRMAMQIKNFYIPYIESTERAENHYTRINKNDEVPVYLTPTELDIDHIRITPSKDLNLPLGKQAIPFYYYVSNDPNSIHHFWDFDAVYCCKRKYQLSYHSEEENSYVNECAVRRPLAHSIYPHSFYRIEGVIGQETDLNQNINDELLHKLWELRIRFNLKFQVLRLPFNQFFWDFENDADFQIYPKYLGAEHIGGVTNGGSYILLVNDNGIVVADFWLTNCCYDKLVRIAGRIIDGCRNTVMGIKATFDIEGISITTSDEGEFSVLLSPGNYTIKLRDTNYYFENNESKFTVSDDLEVQNINITAYPTITLEIILKGEIDDTKEVSLKKEDSSEIISKVNESSNIIFEGLQAGKYVITRGSQGTRINLDRCTTTSSHNIPKSSTESESSMFPPKKEDQWKGWIGRPDNISARELIDKYSSLWKPRVESTTIFLNKATPDLKKELESYLDPIIYDFDLTNEDLGKHYNSLVEITAKHQNNENRSDWEAFMETITEMYLERVALQAIDFDNSIHHNLSNLITRNILNPKQLRTFIEAWKSKVKGITNPKYEEILNPDAIIRIASNAKRNLGEGHTLEERKIPGLGKKAKEWLLKNKIDTFEKLAGLEPEALKQIMEKSDSVPLKRMDVSTWNKQAQLLIDNRLDELEQLQQELKKGKQVDE